MNTSRPFSVPRFRGLRPNGFTLVEMLVVLAIIGILTGISVTAFLNVKNSANLSSAAQMLMSELTLARQTALTLNEPLEVRFYQFPDSTAGPTGTPEYQAVQSFGIKDGVRTALGKIDYLPPNIMISANLKYSAPLGGATLTHAANGDSAIAANGVGINYSYASVLFKPDGTIDATPPLSSWFITLYEKKYATTGTPVNFITLCVDPSNGRVRTFQP